MTFFAFLPHEIHQNVEEIGYATPPLQPRKVCAKRKTGDENRANEGCKQADEYPSRATITVGFPNKIHAEASRSGCGSVLRKITREREKSQPHCNLAADLLGILLQYTDFQPSDSALCKEPDQGNHPGRWIREFVSGQPMGGRPRYLTQDRRLECGEPFLSSQS